jgi:hypothetical protein
MRVLESKRRKQKIEKRKEEIVKDRMDIFHFSLAVIDQEGQPTLQILIA